ncbi:MAG: hypothetical protein GXO91_03280 [FCB group bacterium]|nr:hypothetical protein [FCB group bacterium]
MKSKKYLLNIPLLLVLFYLSCSPDEKSLTAPFDNPNEFLTISHFQIGSSQLIANTDTTTVSATIQNSNEEPVEGIIVTFSATSGEILYADTSSFSLTGVDGKASARYVPGADYGENSIYISAGAAKDTLTLTISPQELTLVVTPSETEILGDGVSETEVEISMIDQYNSALQGLEIQCSSDLGTLSDLQLTTDSDGLAVTTLTSIGTESDETATISCSLTEDATIAGSATVEFTGLTLEVTTEEEFFESDQGSIQITAFLHETTTGLPVSGEILEWSTTQGTIDDTSQTDSDGMATALLIPIQGQTGEVTITASVGTGEVNSSTAIYFVAQSISNIDLLPDADHILADGVSTVLFTATALDESENPAAFVSLQFTTDNGKFSNGDQNINVLTDSDGVAEVELTSAPGVFDMDATVSAFAEIDSSVVAQAVVQFRGITFAITSQIDTLIADGTTVTDITAQARETSNGNPLFNQTVNWSTTMGVILGASETDLFGFTSTQLMSSYEDGHAVVEATLGDGISDTLEFEFVSLSISHIFLAASDYSIVADGVTTTDLYITAEDEVGNPVEGAAVALTAELGTFINGENYLELATGAGGTATVSLTGPASDVDLTGLIQASAVNDDNISADLQLDFRGISFTITSDFDALIADGNSLTEIEVLVRESTSGNPIINRPVTWATTMGTITGTTTTNTYGIASTQLVNDYETGPAVITASFGNLFTDTLEFEFVMQTVSEIQLDVSSNSIYADGLSSVDITLITLDASGNHLGNSSLTLTTDHGLLSGGVQELEFFTDNDGYAQVSLTSEASVLDETAHLNVTLTDGSVSAATEVDFRGLTLEITSAIDTLVADGSTETGITAHLKETSNNFPVAGHTIYWSTTLGGITESSVTDELGDAVAQLTASSDTGLAAVEALITSNLSDTIEIEFVPVTVEDLAVEVSETSILADGTSTAVITATALDYEGNIVPGAILTLTTVNGSFSNDLQSISLTTGAEGMASAVLTSPASREDLLSILTLELTSDPSVVVYDLIEFRGVSFDITTEIEALIADGTTNTPIYALVKETTNGNAVSNATVNWATTMGVITAESQTNSLGVAYATLVSSYETGDAVISASFGNELNDELAVQFVETGIYDVSFTSYQNSIPADGVSTLTLSAVATNAIGVPLENSPIEFSTEYGSFLNGQQTYQTTSNIDGIVTAVLSGVASEEDILNDVTVAAIDNPAITDTMNVQFRGISVTITTEVDTLIADGGTTTVISALIRETTSLSPITGEQVFWSTTLGSIDASSETDQFGIATAVLTSSPIPGSTIIEASTWGGLSAELSVEFIPLAIASISATASASSIYADGASQVTFYVTAYDERGSTMQGEPIHFATDLGTFSNGEEEIELLTDEEGMAAAHLTSIPSTVDEIASVYIFAVNDPAIYTDFEIEFRGITIYIDSEVDTLLADINTITPITAYVVESSTGNPVINGGVTWTTTLGVITETTFTNNYGETSAELISFDQPGLAIITALFGSCSTGQQNCLTATISCNFGESQIPTYLILSAGPSDDNQDGTITTPITAVLTDQNSYGIANYTINFSVEPDGWGLLEPPSDVTNSSGIANTAFIWPAEHAFESVTIIATAYAETGDVINVLPITLTISRGN